VVGLVPPTALPGGRAPASSVALVSEWLCIIRPPRATFMEDSSPEEDEIMGAHFEYLKGLLEEGTLILAGPSLEPPFGIIVFEAETEEEARRLIADDPSVKAGLQTPELHAFRASLLRRRDQA
jgi:uncharacterized protein